MARPRPESRATAARLEDDDHVARPRCRSQGPSAIAARLSSRTTAWCGRGFGVEGDGGAVVEQDDRVARPRLRSRGRRRRSRRGGRPSGAAESPESWATAARSSRRTTESRMTAAHSSRRRTAWRGRVATGRSQGQRRRGRRGGRPSGAAESPESRATAARSSRRTTAARLSRRTTEWRGQGFGVEGGGAANRR